MMALVMALLQRKIFPTMARKTQSGQALATPKCLKTTSAQMRANKREYDPQKQKPDPSAKEIEIASEYPQSVSQATLTAAKRTFQTHFTSRKPGLVSRQAGFFDGRPRQFPWRKPAKA
ncbi:MAG: hypothetical protein OIF40_04595 [Mangrovicoccus sp.]|nr:hypothetical protein [Mangrovicoccus sp.]